MIYAAVLGYGTVGSGVVEALGTNREKIAAAVGDEIAVKYVLDLREFPGDPAEKLLVHDFSVIEEDDSVQIVVETMGGVHPAYEFSLAALKKGKSVCTSNKALVAEKGCELMAAARENGCSYLFEASCGGGIPVIRALNTSLAGEKITEIAGILNGTTNYILTRMEKEHLNYPEVLADAQALGYAEKDPTADVEGHDACRKLAILTSLACGKRVEYTRIPTEGISGITQEDFRLAAAAGCRIRLLADAVIAEEQVEAVVAPFAVPENSFFYGINDVFNAVSVTGNVLGEAVFVGRGAGKLATASAVVGDVLDCAKNIGKTIPSFWAEEEPAMAEKDSLVFRFLVSIPETEKSKAEAVFGATEFFDAGTEGRLAFLTGEMQEQAFDRAFAELENARFLRARF